MLIENNLGVWKVKLLAFEMESEDYEQFEEGDEVEVFKYHLKSTQYADGNGFYEYRLVRDPNIFWMSNEVEEIEKSPVGIEEFEEFPVEVEEIEEVKSYG